MRIGFFILAFLVPALLQAEIVWKWVDARELTVEGKGWSDVQSFYDRLPGRAQKQVRPAVWKLSRDSAGILVRFRTDAPTIQARWVLRETALDMPHMPSSGMSGLDLYVKQEGQWRWVGAGRPARSGTNSVVLVKDLPVAEREFILYLPLYNGVHSVEVAVPFDAQLSRAPVRPQKPIVMYGTSILQGGCASRPGMAYPAILGRKLDWPVINLGFSGNAKSEPELAALLAELDAALFVIDPIPNMDPALVRERLGPLVETIRKAHPKTPIVMVEGVDYTDSHLVTSRRERCEGSQAAMREVFQQLRKRGGKNLHFVPAKNLLGNDGEGTVDGTHPTDLGFLRMAEAMEPVLKKALPRR